MDRGCDSSVLQIMLDLDLNSTLHGEQKHSGSPSSNDRMCQGRYNLRSLSRALGSPTKTVNTPESCCELSPKLQIIPSEVPRTTLSKDEQQPVQATENLDESVMPDPILKRGTIDSTSLAKHIDSLTKAAASSCNETVDQGQFSEQSYFVQENKLERTPFVNLILPNKNFIPVDICKGVNNFYVTSQASNEVAAFKNDTFVEMLSLRNDVEFRGPRNVIGVNLKNKVGSSTVIVLDDAAFHWFDEESGKHIGKFMKGSRYRGLGYFRCQVEKLDYLVSLDISQASAKGITNVCVFSLNELGMQLKKEVPITGNDDPGCKFLTIVSDCSAKCESHVALVTAMKSRKVFEVNLTKSRTKGMEFKTEHSPEFTFCDTQPSATVITFANPSGICSDSLNNIIVADEETGMIKVFSSNGVLISTIDTSSNPVGLYLDEAEGYLYLAAWKPGCVQKIKTR